MPAENKTTGLQHSFAKTTNLTFRGESNGTDDSIVGSPVRLALPGGQIPQSYLT